MSDTFFREMILKTLPDITIDSVEMDVGLDDTVSITIKGRRNDS